MHFKWFTVSYTHKLNEHIYNNYFYFFHKVVYLYSLPFHFITCVLLFILWECVSLDPQFFWFSGLASMCQSIWRPILADSVVLSPVANLPMISTETHAWLCRLGPNLLLLVKMICEFREGCVQALVKFCSWWCTADIWWTSEQSTHSDIAVLLADFDHELQRIRVPIGYVQK